MPTLDATIGGMSANTYVDASVAVVITDDRLQIANWSAADAEDRARALIMAAKRLDQLEFEGSKVASGQALKWPRIDAFDDNGDEYASDAIPEVIQWAAVDVAIWLLNLDADGEDGLAPTGLEGFDRVKVGPLEVEPNHGHRAGALPPAVMRLLRPLLLRGGSGIMAELVRS